MELIKKLLISMLSTFAQSTLLFITLNKIIKEKSLKLVKTSFAVRFRREPEVKEIKMKPVNLKTKS